MNKVLYTFFLGFILTISYSQNEKEQAANEFLLYIEELHGCFDLAYTDFQNGESKNSWKCYSETEFKYRGKNELIDIGLLFLKRSIEFFETSQKVTSNGNVYKEQVDFFIPILLQINDSLNQITNPNLFDGIELGFIDLEIVNYYNLALAV